MKEIRTIALVGAGNAGTHLARAWQGAGVGITAVASATQASARRLAGELRTRAAGSVEEVAAGNPDLLVLAVPDGEIAGVAARLTASGLPMVHTSGATPLDALGADRGRCGVIYPLQTLTRNESVDLGTVPLCVHAGSANLLGALLALARRISAVVREVNDEERLKLHLAAVFVNNNVNHLLARVRDFLPGPDEELLGPLLAETVRKAATGRAREIQTGPARRHDESTRLRHLELLRRHGDDRLIQMYTYFWRSIEEYYRDEFPGKGQ